MTKKKSMLFIFILAISISSIGCGSNEDEELSEEGVWVLNSSIAKGSGTTVNYPLVTNQDVDSDGTVEQIKSYYYYKFSDDKIRTYIKSVVSSDGGSLSASIYNKTTYNDSNDVKYEINDNKNKITTVDKSGQVYEKYDLTLADDSMSLVDIYETKKFSKSNDSEINNAVKE